MIGNEGEARAKALGGGDQRVWKKACVLGLREQNGEWHEVRQGRSMSLIRVWSLGQPQGLSGLAPPSAQGLILGTGDRVPRRAPCMEPASPSAWISASLRVSRTNRKKSLKTHKKAVCCAAGPQLRKPRRRAAGRPGSPTRGAWRGPAARGC